MRIGKLDPDVLKRDIFPYLGKKRKEVILRAEIGEDSAVLDFDGELAVFSVDPITGAGEHVGYFAVNVSVNDVVTNGAEPLALMISALFPEEIEKEDIVSLMKEIHKTASSLGVEVVGGHTEVTKGLKFPILTTFAIGKVSKDKLLTSSSSSPGDTIIITKGVGIEGTSILASIFSSELEETYGRDFVERAKGYLYNISVVKEALLVRDYVSSMHDATEGGVYGAIYELSYASGLGFVIYEDSIPVSYETRKICDYFHINPYFLISSGTLIITTPHKEEVLDILKSNNIEAWPVGVMVDGDMRIKRGNREYPFVPQTQDELWKILERG